MTTIWTGGTTTSSFLDVDFAARPSAQFSRGIYFYREHLELEIDPLGALWLHGRDGFAAS
jgi:hypothetical protein